MQDKLRLLNIRCDELECFIASLELKNQIMKKNEMRILFSNYDIFADFSLDCYKQWLEDNGNIVSNNLTEDDENYIRWVYESSHIDWEDFIENLECSRVNQGDWYSDAIIERWNGTLEGNYISSSLVNAIELTIGECPLYEISMDRKHIHIKATHHDGTNHFDIYLLTDVGYDRYQRRGKVSILNRENVERLPEFLF